MLVAAELHNPLQSICSLACKLRTPLMSLTWQRTTVAETCKLKAERVNGEAYNEHIKSTHFKKIGYRESPTKTTCYSFEYTISHTVCQQKQKTQYHDAINYICHLQEFKLSEHHTHCHTMQFSRSHRQPLQKPREVQEMLKNPVGQSSLVSRTFSVPIRIWMFTPCTMHLVSTFTSEPRKEIKR